MLRFPSALSLAALFTSYDTSGVVICIVFPVVMIYSLMFSLKVSNPFKMLCSSSQLWLRFPVTAQLLGACSSPSYYFQDSSEVGVRCHILSREPVLRTILTGGRKQYDRRCHEKSSADIVELASNNPNPFTERLGIYVLLQSPVLGCCLWSQRDFGAALSATPPRTRCLF